MHLCSLLSVVLVLVNSLVDLRHGFSIVIVSMEPIVASTFHAEAGILEVFLHEVKWLKEQHHK